MPRGVRVDWTEIDKLILEGALTNRELSDKYELSLDTINKRFQKFGIVKFSRNVWTKRQDNFLRVFYRKYGGRYCSDKLKIPLTAVNKRAQLLGVKYRPKDFYIDVQGYKVVGKSHNRQYEHRKVMEEKLGRKLLPTEIVHHKDRNKKNNDPENLALTTRSDHIEEHRKELLEAQRKEINTKI